MNRKYYKNPELETIPFLIKRKFNKSNLIRKININRKQCIKISHKVRSWKLPVQQIQIRVSSPNQIRILCLRQNCEGVIIGRVWNARTVNYKDLKSIPGGLFCESAFGSIQQGSCSCQRIQWRRYPKSPKKLRRIEVLSCSYCLTYTIYLSS